MKATTLGSFWILLTMLVVPVWAQDGDRTTPSGGDPPVQDQAEQQEDETPQTPLEKLRELQEKYGQGLRELTVEFRSAEDNEARAKISQKRQELEAEMAEAANQLAEESDDPEFQAQALGWIALTLTGEPAEKATKRLLEEFPDSPVIGELAMRLARARPGAETENTLRQIVESAKEPATKGLATYALASYFENLKRYAELDDETKQRVAAAMGEGGAEYLKKWTPEAINQEAIALLEKCVEDYGDVEMGRGTLGELADNKLFALKYLQIGKEAPDIEGQDLDGVDFKLSDYRGKIVVLDFWGDW